MGLLALAAGAALLPGPVEAAPLPDATGGATFTGFQDVSGGAGVNIDSSCNATFTPFGSATCAGKVFYAGGPLGPGIHVTGSANGAGTASIASGGTVTAHLDVTGGDANSGAKSNTVETALTYYFSVGALGLPPVAVADIPLIFVDNGSLTGVAAAHGSVSGDAETSMFAIQGSINVDGTSTSVSDRLHSAASDSFALSYSHDHSVIFTLGSAVEVDLFASCGFAAITAGATSGTCDASADPEIIFDQATFDDMMGPNTFKLSDFFEIILSPNFVGSEPTSVPEPGTFAILGLGLAGLGLMRRKRAT